MADVKQNFQEAYELSQQIFTYEPQTIKMAARSDTSQPLVETDRGQYLQIANDLQRMKHRECVIRQYQSEKVLGKHVLWVRQTKGVPQSVSYKTVERLKKALLKRRAVSVKDALSEINGRRLKAEQKAPPRVPEL